MSFETNNDLLKGLGIELVNGDASGKVGDTASAIALKVAEESFHGAGNRIADVEVLVEKPVHRLMCFMKCKGASYKQIAQETGYTPVMVSTILRQPWALKKMSEIINESGGEDIKTILASAAVDSVYKLIELRDNDKVQPSVQRAACVDLLDRFMGKPTQQVEITQDPMKGKSFAEIDSELNALKAEENRLQGTFTS